MRILFHPLVRNSNCLLIQGIGTRSVTIFNSTRSTTLCHDPLNEPDTQRRPDSKQNHKDQRRSIAMHGLVRWRLAGGEQI